MIKKVYLLWNSYVTKELLVIASLTEVENKGYVFKYEKDAIKAEQLGCFLPFNYTEEELCFNSLPYFFSQRMLKSKYYIDKFGINYDCSNELDILTYGNSVKNNDNFSIVSEEKYQNLKEVTDINETKDDAIEKKYPLRK